MGTLDVLRDDLERTRTTLDASLAAHLVDRGRAERAETQASALAARMAAIEMAEAAAQTLARQREAELIEERLRAAAADAEAKVTQEAIAREVRRLEQVEAALKAAEAQRDAAQAARDATQAELARWAAGGPLVRALRALAWRRL